MDREWSEHCKAAQQLLKKADTFGEGIRELLALRNQVFEQITQIVNACPVEAFSRMPFAGAQGYHSKTLAYSIWHIFRIEDIVAHELIMEDRQVLLADAWQERVNSPLTTTGNELSGDGIKEFSEKLNVRALYDYALAVKDSTDKMLSGLTFADTKRRFTDADRERLLSCGCVSTDESAVWLIDYWCGKSVQGLLFMPFSRHWIMHTEAMRRIKNRLCKEVRKGIDPVAYCGFSCNHCFLAEWCGSCRSNYNTCSFALCSPGGICPNAECCREKGYDGCYECAELETCGKGFYVPGNDGAQAAKAQALFIRLNGKKAFLKAHDLMHEKYTFSKTQEILGQDMHEGLRILEDVCKR